MRKSLKTIGSALKTLKLGIMCPKQLFNNLFVGINGMSFKNSLAKVYDIMLTPTTGLYKTSKGIYLQLYNNRGWIKANYFWRFLGFY